MLPAMRSMRFAPAALAATVLVVSVVVLAAPLAALQATPTPPYKPATTATATSMPVILPAQTLLPTPTRMGAGPAPSSTPRTRATATPPATETPGPTPDRVWRHVRVPILMYHYVTVPPPGADNYRVGLSVTPEQFREQMTYLVEHGYTTVTLDDVLFALNQGRALPPKPVVLSFDDGYAEMYTNVFPVLQELGLVGTFFVVTGWIDDENPDFLSWTQAREMAEAGMRIESHSKSHPDLSDKPRDYIVYEVLGSIESIEAHVGRRPRFFCYPAGAFDDYLVSLLPEFGLWGAVTTQAGTRHYSDAPYTMRRVRISNDTTLAQFAAFLEWGKEGD